MTGKIAIEEHWASASFREYTARSVSGFGGMSRIERKLADIEEMRLPEMDQCGIEMAILSLTAEGIQAEPDARRSPVRAQQANDELARVVEKHPKRFAAFAALPLHDATAAANELERAVKELNFKGAMVNGFQTAGDGSKIEYLDHPKFTPLWERVEALNVPVYLHPRDAHPSQQSIYEGRPELIGPAWGWAVETGTHALRILFGGVFDRFPKATLILGHMGENIPFVMHRIESRYRLTSRGAELQKPVSQYFRENVYITTSGQYRTQVLLNGLLEVGAERILFAADYPFESSTEAAGWLDTCPISDADREKIGRSNAERLFRLDR